VCYSAEVYAAYDKFVRLFGATMSVREFYEIFYRRSHDPEAKIKVPKAMELAFEHPTTDAEREVKALIDEFNASETTRVEQELFAQRKRLADAERTLATKSTKGALESKRIATDKVSKAMTKLNDLQRKELKPRDSRIFPGVYAPVMAMHRGELVVMPMRYQCRPAGKPAFYDTKFPGTYNARRDNLEGFWKDLFGFSHGVMLATTFYENVKRHNMEGRELAEGEKEENVVLEFKPNGLDEMWVACVWSRWTAPGQPTLLSFAAITDEPPPEVAAAGHDRCIIPIKPDNVMDWLTPEKSSLAAMYAILDDKEQPYYEHRLAA
jgi:putative SOS response-associated peptidase YedK